MSRVYVLGSLNQDTFVQVDNFVRRGQTIAATAVRRANGGKGLNQAVAAARMGSEVLMVGALGADETAEAMRAALVAEQTLDLTHVLAIADRPTSEALIQVSADGDNAIVVVPGANDDNDPDSVRARLAGIGPGDTLVCQLEIPRASVQTGLEMARERGARTILNAAPAAPVTAMLPFADVLVVNEIEAETILGRPADDPAQELSAAHGVTTIVTLGADGSLLAREGAGSRRVAALAVEAVDTTGAGDAFVGALAAQLAEGRDLEAATSFASSLSARVCLTEGAQGYPERRADVERILAQ